MELIIIFIIAIVIYKAVDWYCEKNDEKNKQTASHKKNSRQIQHTKSSDEKIVRQSDYIEACWEELNKRKS